MPPINNKKGEINMKTLRYGILTVALVCALATGFFTMTSTAQAGGPNPAVVLDTTMGRIILILYPSEAPNTVKNFLKYVDEGFYDGTIFHRVVNKKDFKGKASTTVELPYSMIQGGLDKSMRQKRPTHPPIKSEASKALLNKKGTIAMARGADPDSATCQFFINVDNNTMFDYSMTKKDTRFKTKEDQFTTNSGYTAFGKVIRGMDVVEKINEVQRHKKGRYEDVPVKPIVIKKAYRPQ